MTDNINHPKHYNSSGVICPCGRQIECIDIARTFNFTLGNVIKYIWRHEHKEGLISLKKAAWYLNNEIERLERENDRS